MIDYTSSDREAIGILDAFLPGRIFDAHMHISPYPFSGAESFGIDEYMQDVGPIFSDRYVRCAALMSPTVELRDRERHDAAVRFLADQLDRFPDCVGEVMVKPEETYGDIEAHVCHERIKGLKCYHKYACRKDTPNADIHEYLSESALAFANDHGMAVTLHLVKDRALSDPDNMREIEEIAVRYPDIKLILAHSARAFAAWTAIDAVSRLARYENVYFDFSAICESPSMIAILRSAGVSRCLWGSDYNVSALLGKAVSVGDGFYWINEGDLARFSQPVRPRHIIVENLMAVREACLLLDLSERDVEDIFYDNACRIFGVDP